MLVIIANFSISVIVVNRHGNVLSQSIVSADVPTFITNCYTSSIFIIGLSIISRSKESVSRLIIIGYMSAPSTRSSIVSTFISQGSYPTIFRKSFIVSFVAPHIFICQVQIFSNIKSYTNIVNFFMSIFISRSLNYAITFKIVSICINYTNFGSNASYIQTISSFVSGTSSFQSSAPNLNLVTIGYFYAISINIENRTSIRHFVVTTSGYSQATNFTFNISTTQSYITIVACIILKILDIFNHTSVLPIIINLTSYPQTSTQIPFAVFFKVFRVSITETSLATNLYIVSFLFQISNTNTQIIQLVSEFSSQLVNVSAFCHSTSSDLSHFITGHQLVATEGGVAITIDYASSCQFSDAVICPVASRNIRERASSVCGSSYAQSHSHCEY